MRRDARAYLWDVKQAADAIDRFLDGIDSSEYLKSEMLRSAVERKFEIVGEALGRLMRTHPQVAARIPDAAQIVAFRNILIHGYATVDDNRVWRIANESLPGLRRVVAEILSELSGKGGQDQNNDP